MREVTVSEVERLHAGIAEEDVAFEMDEEAFRAFYDRTARLLWAYLSRLTGNPSAADDLLQESYYRFLRARAAHESEAHRRNYLFRIATNLVRDGHRRRTTSPECSVDPRDCAEVVSPLDPHAAEKRTDFLKAMRQLKPRDRALLWLAYAQGSSHREIGDALGLKSGSVKPLLFRARRRLADLLGRGPASGVKR